MTKGELIKLISHLPDETPIVLVDLSTDDVDESNYPLTPESFSVEDVEDPSTNEPLGKGLLITFFNKLNPHPLK